MRAVRSSTHVGKLTLRQNKPGNLIRVVPRLSTWARPYYPSVPTFALVGEPAGARIIGPVRSRASAQIHTTGRASIIKGLDKPGLLSFLAP